LSLEEPVCWEIPFLRRLRDRSPDDDLLALVRGTPDDQVFAGIDVEFIHGDLGDRESADAIDRAVASCDGVIHSAAMIHLGWKKRSESMAVNRDGTQTIADACRHHDVPMVYVGTVDTLAVGNRTAPADETTPLDSDGGKIPCSYVVSKRAGAEVVRQMTKPKPPRPNLDPSSPANRTLKAVLVHPGFMLGPWDWKPSSGRMIREVVKTWRPIAPAGGCSVCDSRDVADGTIAALDALIDGRIENGREYILAGENWTYFKLWREITRRTGTRGPIMPAGPGQLFIGQMAAGVMSRLTADEGDFNTASIAMSSQFHWYDSSRARSELGFQNRSIDQTLDDAVEWICGRAVAS
jgi:dihydroflavonol-4-reductase